MTRNLRTVFVLTFGLLFAVAPLLAHHYGGTVYDDTKRVTLKGKITKLDWLNPHVYYYISVTDEKGQVVNWEAESGPPNALYRRGWRKDALKAGDTVTLTNAALARNGSKKVSGGTLTFPDGRKVFSGTSGDGLDRVQ
jgi:hypothetical protein